jgi:SAM-dependent methyltransferase
MKVINLGEKMRQAIYFSVVFFWGLNAVDVFIVNPEKIHLIEKAWAINTSGDKVPSYYSIIIKNNHFFPGIRPFELRWNMIKDVLDYAGKNILELGCCTALPSALLKKYRNADRVVAVDMAAHRLQAAQLLAQAFEVDIEFYKLHFGDDAYEKILGYDFDIVFCMSLLYWIPDKDRFMRYLSHFKNIIFEGHDSPTTEIERFKKYGFDYKHLGVSDKGRTLFLFYK